MPEYLSPGVYVEEISGPRPIEGVSTSTAGFVGQTERGPTTPRLVTSWQDYYRWFGGYIDDRTDRRFLPYAVKGFFDNGGQRLFVARVIGNQEQDRAVTANQQLNDDAGGQTQVQAIGQGSWGNNIYTKVAPAGQNHSHPEWFRLVVMYFRDPIPPNQFVDPTDPKKLTDPNRREPDLLEDYDNLSAQERDSNYAQTMVNSRSHLIEMGAVASRLVDTPEGQLADSHLGGGTDVDAAERDYSDPDTLEVDQRRGLAGLGAIDAISILSVPDEVVIPELTNAVLDQCEILKDRFAILNSSENEGDPQDINPPRDSSYGAFYFPWIRVSAPHTAEGHILVPPSGHVSGIYARSDIERGVHKAPANEVVRGIITRDLNGNKKPLRFTINKAQHDLLNPKGVNVIRDFRVDRRGIRVWGARTMSSDAEWKYVNVRRLFLFVEESIDEGTQWVVFEPNDEPTWAKVRRSITNFLISVWRSGALMGTTQEEAFFVKCDRTTMTQDDIDNGRLICLIGIAPVKPAEFVIFRISQKTAFEEAA